MAKDGDLTWAEKLCRMMELNLTPENVNLASEFLDHYQVASGKDLAEHIALTESAEWRKAVQDELVVLHILDAENEKNPRKALQDIIWWNQKIALDPAVSAEARALQASGQTILVKFKGRPVGPYSGPHKEAAVNPARVGWIQADGWNTHLWVDGKWFEVSGQVDEVAKRLGLVKSAVKE